MPPTVERGGNKRCFCPSACPSVVYIANNSRTQRPNVPKFGMKVLHFRCDSHTSFKSDVQRSGLQTGEGKAKVVHIKFDEVMQRLLIVISKL